MEYQLDVSHLGRITIWEDVFGATIIIGYVFILFGCFPECCVHCLVAFLNVVFILFYLSMNMGIVDFLDGLIPRFVQGRK